MYFYFLGTSIAELLKQNYTGNYNSITKKELVVGYIKSDGMHFLHWNWEREKEMRNIDIYLAARYI
jgi:hypothetical protein